MTVSARTPIGILNQAAKPTGIPLIVAGSRRFLIAPPTRDRATPEAASGPQCFVVQLTQHGIKTIPASADRISSVGKARGLNKATMT
jgi:hypothetical protein